MGTVAVVIITLNEEANIERCLRSVSWADRKIVVDSGSADATVPLCEAEGGMVINTEWKGFGPTRQIGVNAADTEWILALDADEEVSPVLADRIRDIVNDAGSCDGYRIRERTYYRGKMVRFCGWGNEYHLRLFRKKAGNFNDRQIHESVRLNGTIGKIKESLLHHSFPTKEAHLEKIVRYTDLSAREMFGKGKHSSLPTAWLRGGLTFIKMYILKAGILDGKNGFTICRLSAYYTYLKYRKLKDLAAS